MSHSISLEREISADALILLVDRFRNQEQKLWKGVRRHEGPVDEAEEIQLSHTLAF
jgi:hypothetical protein